MDFRKPFSKPFKKLKDKLLRGNRKRDGRSGGEDGRMGRGSSIEASEASQQHSHLHSGADAEGAVESGPSRAGINADGKKPVLVNVNPPTSTPLISNIKELDGMWTVSLSEQNSSCV